METQEKFWPADATLFGMNKSDVIDMKCDPTKPSFNQCPDMQPFIEESKYQQRRIVEMSMLMGRICAIQHTRMLDKGFYKSFWNIRTVLVQRAEQDFQSWKYLDGSGMSDQSVIKQAEQNYRQSQKELLEYTTNFILSKLYLIQEENCEGGSALREGDKMDDKLPHRRGIAAELADLFIRGFDLAAFLGIDLGQVIKEKMEFNLSRPEMHGKNA